MRLSLAAAFLVTATSPALSGLVVEHELDAGDGFRAYLVSYQSAGLKVHALIAEPTTKVPDGGFPVVIANHGYVPDPKRYGITADGRNSRPGDYYRSVPGLYTSRGFLVVMPDYRGHNDSEGYELIRDQGKGPMSRFVEQYAEDVLALMSCIDDLDNANPDKVVLWSHSMGGGVAMRVLLSSGLARAATFWATMPLDDLESRIDELQASMIIHHAAGDVATSVMNSQRLAADFERLGQPHVLHIYEGDDHFFEGSQRQMAADRDVDFFNLRFRIESEVN